MASAAGAATPIPPEFKMFISFLVVAHFISSLHFRFARVLAIFDLCSSGGHSKTPPEIELTNLTDANHSKLLERKQSSIEDWIELRP